VYFERQLRAHGVEFLLGSEVTADELVAFGPDAVVVATGGLPAVPGVPGIADGNVVQALDLLTGNAPTLSGDVLVVGGLDKHIGAATMAEYARDQGCEVQLIGEHTEFAAGAEDGTRLELLHRLLTKGVTVRSGYKLARVEHGDAAITQTFTGSETLLPQVTVVLACGQRPDDRLATELRGRIAAVHLIGDALAPRRIGHATLEGARVGAAL
jgi:pyruvate/2-oxoglutarate dehydrogenase complex dihydrolipoamide dehydrogenase (E3) component